MEAVCRQTLYLYAKLAAEIYSSLQVYPVDSLCKLEVSKLCDLLECASELRVHSVYALRSDRDRYELGTEQKYYPVFRRRCTNSTRIPFFLFLVQQETNIFSLLYIYVHPQPTLNMLYI